MTYRLWWTVGYTCTSEREFLAAGGKLIFPLPNLEVVGN